MRAASLMILIATTASAVQAERALAQDKANAPAPIRQPGPPQMTTPGTPPTAVVVGGDAQNAGPGANATVARSGTGADTVTTDSAVGGNAEQPSRAVPQAGGGGGGGGGGGQ